MKRKEKWTPHIIAVTALVVFIVLGLACATTQTTSNLGVYGDVSEDQLCTLEIAGGLKVVGFNGVKVSWAENGTVREEGTLSSNAWRAVANGSKYKTIIRIPSGNHSLEANLYLWDYNSYPGVVPGSGYIRASGLIINNNFEAGKTYFLRPVLIVKPLGREEVEVVEYNNSGPTGGFQGVRLRIEENGTSVAEGNTITR